MKRSYLIISVLLPLISCALLETQTPKATDIPTHEPTTGDIIGTVIDSGTGVPVPAANVSTDPPTNSVTTDDKGIYSIPRVRPGEYTITATKSSYANASVRISVVAGSTTTADLHLTQKVTNEQTPTDGLVAYYPFDGNANDESGNGHDGDVSGKIDYVDGIVGKAVNFNGGGKKVKTNFALKDDFSILLWGFTKDGNYDDYLMLSASDQNGHWLFQINAIRQNDGRFLMKVDSDFIDTTYTVIKNQWVHYSIIRKDSRVYFFVNGELLMSESCGDKNISNLVLGGHFSDTGDGVTERYVGMLDEVRFYDRALSDSEIQMIYEVD